MITKEIEIDGEQFRLVLTDQIINQVNNLKSLYNAAYDDPESFEQVSAEISSIIQEISNAVEPKTVNMYFLVEIMYKSLVKKITC